MVSKLEDMSTEDLKSLLNNNKGSAPEFAALLRNMLRDRAETEKAAKAQQATRDLAEQAGVVFTAISNSNDLNVALSTSAAYKGAERMLTALIRVSYSLSAAKASAAIHAMSEHGYGVPEAVKAATAKSK